MHYDGICWSRRSVMSWLTNCALSCASCAVNRVLKLHNEVFRGLLTKHHGYESQTEGVSSILEACYPCSPYETHFLCSHCLPGLAGWLLAAALVVWLDW